MKTFGIDISHHQRGMNLSIAKNQGVEFVIIRAGYKNRNGYKGKDECFEKFYSEAKKLGLKVGAYFYGDDLNVDSAVESAKFFLDCIKGKQFEMPIYYDVEGHMVANTNATQLTNIVEAFCKHCEHGGYLVGTYCGMSIRQNEMHISNHWCVWIPAWRATKPNGADVWQFGGETNKIRSNRIAGMICDQDYCFVDYETNIKNRGLNGFAKQEIPTQSIKNTSKDYIYSGLNYAPVFNAEYYARMNPDVSKACAGDAKKLFKHFVTFGMNEARIAHPNFNVKAYRKYYDDLDDAFGNDWTLYYRHYIQYGIAEKRKAT